MGTLYLTRLAQLLRDAGLQVVEQSGWQTRARGSGGFDVYPLCVMWHHTASGISSDGQRDADYITYGDANSPIANLYISRKGIVWVCAGGATNTNGKGGPLTFSRGTVPVDGMNTRALGVELGNNGTGDNWPQIQVDAMFVVNNVCNAWFGNRPDDLASHAAWAPSRKIDPARAACVQGPWKPNGYSSADTWVLQDIRDEANRRANQPIPLPPTNEEDMTIRILESQCEPKEFNAMFFAECDSQGRSIEVQWSGDGSDPRVQERIAIMQQNFETYDIQLAGLRNNRLHPKHRPSDIVDSLHVWCDEDFAP